jgi:hypothetical protein
MRIFWFAAAAAAMINTPVPAQTAGALPQAQRQAPSPSPPVPARVTAQQLITLCAQERIACLGYIIGTTDAFAATLYASRRPQIFCVPQGITNDQVGQTVMAYVRAHPEEAQSSAAPVVIAGLSASYRCAQ